MMETSPAFYAMTWQEWVEFELLRYSHVNELDLQNSSLQTSGVLSIAEDCGFVLAEGAVNAFATRKEIKRPPITGGRRTWFAKEIDELLRLLVAKKWELTPLAATCAHYQIRVIDYWKALHAAAATEAVKHGMRVRPNPNFFDVTFAHAWNGFPQRVSFTLRPEYIQLHSGPEAVQ